MVRLFAGPADPAGDFRGEALDERGNQEINIFKINLLHTKDSICFRTKII